ncbi:hypothetical protein CALVIDRAFT_536316 [Calocera viscosa TUFC12733]|uniref:Secreted protein n=1 Tax=Calocera viscosa (strain TUFC12733) TaxID=1330018 RepID=A0A167N351_CALVF|nr:hypothetical protein CALVIDRAFT_536316 [Calocera viscosa TUFC12733]
MCHNFILLTLLLALERSLLRTCVLETSDALLNSRLHLQSGVVMLLPPLLQPQTRESKYVITSARKNTLTLLGGFRASDNPFAAGLSQTSH